MGYGDITPEGTLARVGATCLMLLGIGLIGVITSALSASLIASDRTENAPGLASELERLAALMDCGRLTEEEFARAKQKLLQ